MDPPLRRESRIATVITVGSRDIGHRIVPSKTFQPTTKSSGMTQTAWWVRKCRQTTDKVSRKKHSQYRKPHPLPRRENSPSRRKTISDKMDLWTNFYHFCVVLHKLLNILHAFSICVLCLSKTILKRKTLVFFSLNQGKKGNKQQGSLPLYWNTCKMHALPAHQPGRTHVQCMKMRDFDLDKKCTQLTPLARSLILLQS